MHQARQKFGYINLIDIQTVKKLNFLVEKRKKTLYNNLHNSVAFNIQNQNIVAFSEAHCGIFMLNINRELVLT